MGILLDINVTVTAMNTTEDNRDWTAVLQAAQQLGANCPGAVLIGGLAVYLHTQNRPLGRLPLTRERLVEFSHDVDAYISLLDLGALRDAFEVSANTRLHKHQVRLGDIESDLYVEHNNRLRVPYDELLAHALAYGPLRVAAIGHLLVLKLDAEAGRGGTSKGDKDTRDLIKLAVLASAEDRALLQPYLEPRALQRLREVGASPRAFTLISRGNAQEAKQIRTLFNAFVDGLRTRHDGNARKPAVSRVRRSRTAKNFRTTG